MCIPRRERAVCPLVPPPQSKFKSTFNMEIPSFLHALSGSDIITTTPATTKVATTTTTPSFKAVANNNNNKLRKKRQSSSASPLSSSSTTTTTTTTTTNTSGAMVTSAAKRMEEEEEVLPMTPVEMETTKASSSPSPSPSPSSLLMMEMHAPEPKKGNAMQIVAVLQGEDEAPEVHVPKTMRFATATAPAATTAAAATRMQEEVVVDDGLPVLEDVAAINADPVRYRGPTTESNWVLPGRLMMGAFPASLNDDQHLEISRRLLLCGVRTFVCLQDEYDHLASQTQWREGQRIRPYIFDTAELLKSNSAFRPLASGSSSSSVELLHVAIKDCSITMDQVVRELAEDICFRLYSGEVIYIHCWGGHGRTGTLVAIVLGMMFGLDANEALARTQHFHDLRYSPLGVQSPQTVEQRNQVRRILTQYQLSQQDLLFCDRLRHGRYTPSQSPFVIFNSGCI